jgi:hypothetical protein
MKYLDEKHLEQCNREADNSWYEYQTGQSVSHEDMSVFEYFQSGIFLA